MLISDNLKDLKKVSQGTLELNRFTGIKCR